VRCLRARALLSDYVDGRMPLADAQDLRGHLDSCAGCRRQWQELMALKHLLAAARAPQAPVDFWDRAARQVRVRSLETARRAETRGRWGLTWQRAPALVAGMAAVVTAILVPLSISLDLQDKPALDAHAALAQHVAYSERFPLADRRSMEYVVDESRRQQVEVLD